jgi:hypothetical protein
MDELSPEARAFLKLAQQEHEVPGEQVMGRVRQKVALAVLLPAPGVLASAKLKLGGLFAHGAQGLAAKVTVGVVAASLAAGGAVMLRERPRQAAPVPAGVPVSSVSASAPAPARTPAHPAPAAEPVALEGGQLRAELTLLDRAGARLAQGDLAACLATLAEHRQQFPQALLVEEREGLELLVRCMKAPRLARASAQQFLASHAGAMLGARIRAACKLETP